jgi:hypothetical protein
MVWSRCWHPGQEGVPIPPFYGDCGRTAAPRGGTGWAVTLPERVMTRARPIQVVSLSSVEEAYRVVAILARHKIKAKVEDLVVRMLVRPTGHKPHCVQQRRWAVVVAKEVAAQARRAVHARLRLETKIPRVKR